MLSIPLPDREILRQLGRELAEAAADPVNDERRRVHAAVAIYLKDISTIRHQPRRLADWNRIAMECVDRFAAE